MNALFFFYRYIYVADILDHEIDVFERQEGERLVYVKVLQCFLIFYPKQKKTEGSLTFLEIQFLKPLLMTKIFTRT